jgi:hypothetical protein
VGSLEKSAHPSRSYLDSVTCDDLPSSSGACSRLQVFAQQTSRALLAIICLYQLLVPKARWMII